MNALSPAMTTALGGLLEDHIEGVRRSTGTEGLAVRLGSILPNRYPTSTTWALQQRGLLDVDCSKPGAPVWSLTPEGVEVALGVSDDV